MIIYIMKLPEKKDHECMSDFSCKIQCMVNNHVDSMISKEMEHYKTYKEVYEHVLKLPMVAFSLENNASKENTYMVKKISDLTAEVERLTSEIHELKSAAGINQHTENIRLVVKEPAYVSKRNVQITDIEQEEWSSRHGQRTYDHISCVGSNRVLAGYRQL